MELNANGAANVTQGPPRPGHSGQAAGQQAKAAVAEARAAGLDMPKSAQGRAASAIAKGAEPGSVFAALAVTDATAAEETEAATLEKPPMQLTPLLAQAGYGEAAGVFGDAASVTDNAALDLLAGRGA